MPSHSPLLIDSTPVGTPLASLLLRSFAQIRKKPELLTVLRNDVPDDLQSICHAMAIRIQRGPNLTPVFEDFANLPFTPTRTLAETFAWFRSLVFPALPLLLIFSTAPRSNASVCGLIHWTPKDAAKEELSFFLLHRRRIRDFIVGFQPPNRPLDEAIATSVEDFELPNWFAACAAADRTPITARESSARTQNMTASVGGFWQGLGTPPPELDGHLLRIIGTLVESNAPGAVTMQFPEGLWELRGEVAPGFLGPSSFAEIANHREGRFYLCQFSESPGEVVRWLVSWTPDGLARRKRTAQAAALRSIREALQELGIEVRRTVDVKGSAHAASALQPPSAHIPGTLAAYTQSKPRAAPAREAGAALWEEIETTTAIRPTWAEGAFQSWVIQKV